MKRQFYSCSPILYACIVYTTHSGHWVGSKMGDSSNDSSSDEDICDYERQRLKNIKENQDLLRSLGKTRVYNYVPYGCSTVVRLFNGMPS